MSAMHGLAVSFRTRGRLIALAMGVVLVFGALFASAAGAAAPIKETYFANGDSLAFGYSQQLFNENEKLGEPPAAFEHGYANVYFKKHLPLKNGVQLVNNGCPGETTDSYIGNGTLGLTLEAFAGADKVSQSCLYHYGAGLPLHHEYGGTKSQLENTLETIAVEQLSGTPVTTLSLNIGANDELRSLKQCEKEVQEEFEKEGKSKYGKEGGTPEEAVKACIVEHVKPTFEHISKNIGASLFAIREGSKFGGVNYTGKIVLLGGYDPFGAVFVPGEELLEGSVGLQHLFNVEENKVGEKFAACTADPLSKFNPLNKTEPAKLQKYTNMANFTEFEGKKNGPDIHPTPEGYKVLAAAMLKQCGL